MKNNTVSIKDFIFLHITVFIFAVSLVANKIASNSLAKDGVLSVGFIVGLLAYGILTIVYAITWQLNLERFNLSFLYMNRSFYMVWSQIFAVIIFGNEVKICNIIGISLIIIGVVVNSRDA